MKFRNPDTGEVFDEIDMEKCYWVGVCQTCPMGTYGNKYHIPCIIFIRDHQKEAAEILGYEILED